MQLNLNGFLDGLSKEKYLVYFLLAWAGVLFFWGISGVYFNVTDLRNAYDGIMILTDLLEIGAGAVLAVIAAKLLMPSFMPTMKREPLVIYFLLLWAGSFFFNGIANIAWFAQYGVDIDILGALCALAAGAVLALFAWKLLQSPSDNLAEKLRQPISPTV